MLKKKMVSVLLALSMCLSLAAPAVAVETEVVPTSEVVSIIEESFEVTQAEAVELLIEKAGWNRADAEARVYGPQENVLYSTASGTTSNFYKRQTYTFGSYAIEIGGLYQYWTNGQYRQIQALLDMWTAAVGSGNYTWEEFSLVDTTESYPTHTSTLMATGCITVEVSIGASGSINASLKDELISAGFSVGVTVGTTQYWRRTADLTLVYKTW